MKRIGTIVVDRVAWYLACIKTSFVAPFRRAKIRSVEENSQETTSQLEQEALDIQRPKKSKNGKKWRFSSLPKGWKAYWIKDENAWQYCNKEYRIKQWELPTDSMEFSFVPLPPGWKALKTRKGEWQFINKSVPIRQRQPPSDDVLEDALPSGWTKYLSRDGTQYYRNKALKVEQWTRPCENSPFPTEDLPTGWRFVKSHNGRWYFGNLELNIQQWDYPFDEGVLPSGWRARISRSKCKLYYENCDLKIKQWNPPSSNAA